MNISTKLNSFHGLYLKSKYVFLALFALLVVVAFTSSATVYGSGVVDTVETKIKLETQGKTKTIITTQNTVKAALEVYGFVLPENSITDPWIETSLHGGVVYVEVVPAVPVLIADGNQYWIGKSAYKNPEGILSQLGVETANEDIISSELIMDPVEFGVVGQKVSIQRAPTFTVVADGEEKVVHSWAQTIGEVLVEKGYVLRQNDIVEPAKEISAKGVDKIEITRINFEDIETSEVVQHKTVYKIDSSLGIRETRVAQRGVNGLIKKKYRISYENNIEVDRFITNSEIVEIVQDEIIYKGALVGIASHVSDNTYSVPMSTAFKEAPRGTKLIVTNLSNGRQITVTVVDSGPYVDGRILDLSPDAFRALGGTSGLLKNIAAQIVN